MNETVDERTAEQTESIKVLRETVANIMDLASDESIAGILTSRDAGQVKEAARMMEDGISKAILDKPIERPTSDQIAFVKNVNNACISKFLLIGSKKTMQNLLIEFATMVNNYSAIHGGIKILDESGRAAERLVETRNAFENLIRRSEHLIQMISKVENSVKSAPSTADHMMRVIRNDIA